MTTRGLLTRLVLRSRSAAQARAEFVAAQMADKVPATANPTARASCEESYALLYDSLIATRVTTLQWRALLWAVQGLSYLGTAALYLGAAWFGWQAVAALVAIEGN